MEKKETIDASLIIPCVEKPATLKKTLKAIFKQKCQANEIIIIYSGKYANEAKNQIKFIKADFEKEGVKLCIVNGGPDQIYPGKARNIGINIAKNDWLMFIDVKTIPEEDWIQLIWKMQMKKELKVILGATKYVARSKAQSLLIDSTYGRKTLRTIPGALIGREIFGKVGYFLPNTRCGEDTDWIIRASHFQGKITKAEKTTCLYEGMTNSPATLAIKWFNNYYESCSIVHHLAVQKIYYLVFIFILASTIALRWNNVAASWDTESIFFINNITKLTLLTLAVIYIAGRGIYLPWKKGVKLRHLMPIRFILIASISALLDLAKFGGYSAKTLKTIITDVK